jgi:hypothetical protein
MRVRSAPKRLSSKRRLTLKYVIYRRFYRRRHKIMTVNKWFSIIPHNTAKIMLHFEPAIDI